ncbi:hypothetical protein PQI07_31165 [Methylobacterium sp. 092160098-2]|uniref:hypothetical protein n=1 Tax=Methylobacterium sp. 092160098-2 TaxID=3025129 RepID=UPI0023819F52|nr:hypothetical protein [Methylobacterium sp. 092160098-2]MDE4915099.1 hypothetical protein [Methylobacterium sp. 092160098-2]
MPTRPILIRVAIALVLMAALAALADGVAQHELQQATGNMAGASVVADAQPAGAHDDE